MSSSILIAQSDMNSPVNYTARDSMVADLKMQTVRLYGEAQVVYEDVTLTADFIEIDLEKNEVIATFTTDTTDSIIGKPMIKTGTEETRCDYIKYNFETEKGYLKEARTTQDEAYIHMEIAKRLPNEEIHFKNGKFTTCDKEKPHYHFRLSRAIVVPDKRIVTGPVYMVMFKVPIPLAAPFAFLPNSEDRKHGLIIPSYGRTAQYGFGLQGLGYYFPLGDRWDTQFLGTIFTTGRFGLENVTNYYQKYKRSGSFGVRYEQFRGRFYDTDISDKWTVRWNHTQDAKSHPSLKFNADINFMSDNNGKSSLDVINQDYYNNQFNSAINASKSWRTKKFAGSSSIKSSLQQNSSSKTYTMDLPSINVSVARFDLGVLRKNPIGQNFLNKITVTYSMNARNFIRAPDSIFNFQDYGQIRNYAINGVQHNTAVQSNLQLFRGRMTFTPSINYKENWNFQYEDHEWDDLNGKIDTTKLRGFGASREVSGRAGVVTNFFGYYKMLGKREVRFRHVASPNASFTFRPDVGMWKEIQVDSTGKTQYVSPYGMSLYQEPARGNSAFLSFGLNNTLEMKRKDMKDTINEGVKSLKLIDAASITGSYDFLRDSFKLSNLSLTLRTARFLQLFSFQSSATHTPYSWDETGLRKKEYAWNEGQGIGRISDANVALTANFTNKSGRKKQKEMDEQTKDNAVANGNATNPLNTGINMPWQLNLSYNLNYNRATLMDTLLNELVDSFRLVQTIRADADISFGKNWKINGFIAFDLSKMDIPSNKNVIAQRIATYQVNLWRSLHCWELNFTWGQLGVFDTWQTTNFLFLFRVNIRASMFQDIKLEYNQPPIFF